MRSPGPAHGSRHVVYVLVRVRDRERFLFVFLLFDCRNVRSWFFFVYRSSAMASLSIPPESMRDQFPELKSLHGELMTRSGSAFGALVVLTNPSAINRGLPAVPFREPAKLHQPSARRDGRLCSFLKS